MYYVLLLSICNLYQSLLLQLQCIAFDTARIIAGDRAAVTLLHNTITTDIESTLPQCARAFLYQATTHM
jgi:uncharacterized protein (DUF924 family)